MKTRDKYVGGVLKAFSRTCSDDLSPLDYALRKLPTEQLRSVYVFFRTSGARAILRTALSTEESARGAIGTLVEYLEATNPKTKDIVTGVELKLDDTNPLVVESKQGKSPDVHKIQYQGRALIRFDDSSLV